MNKSLITICFLFLAHIGIAQESTNSNRLESTLFRDSSHWSLFDFFSGKSQVYIKTNYEYSDDRKEEIGYQYKYDSASEVYGVWKKQVRRFDDERRVIRELEYDWNVNDIEWNLVGSDTLIWDKDRVVYEERLYFSDGIIVAGGKDVYEYDEFNNETLAEDYYWSANASDWVGNNKYTRTYSAINRITSFKEYRWNFDKATWDLYKNQNWQYDSNNNLIFKEYLSYNVYGDGSLDMFQDRYGYDANDCLISHSDFIFVNDELIEREKKIYYRNSNCKIDSIYLFQRSNYLQELDFWKATYFDYSSNVVSKETLLAPLSEEIRSELSIDSLDERGNIVVTLIQKPEGDGWINYFKNNFTYDEYDNLILEEESNWIESMNDWQVRNREIQEFDLNGRRTLYELYNVICSSSAGLGGCSKNVSQFDLNGRQTLDEVYQGWNSDGKWTGRYKYEYVYEDSYYGSVQSLVNRYVWNPAKVDWRQNGMLETFFSSNPSPILSVQSREKYTLYPNPASSILFINGLEKTSTIEILSLNGVVLKTHYGQEVIDVGDVKEGIYLIRIKSGAQESTNRLIIRR